YVGLALIGIPAMARRENPSAPPPGPPPGGVAGLLARVARLPLFAVLLAAAAVSLANPFGWRALWQPFEYFLVWRHEPVYQPIPELTPLFATWRSYLASGLPLLVLAWPLLVLVRAAARRFDPVEALTCAPRTALAPFNQRFVGYL